MQIFTFLFYGAEKPICTKENFSSVLEEQNRKLILELKRIPPSQEPHTQALTGITLHLTSWCWGRVVKQLLKCMSCKSWVFFVNRVKPEYHTKAVELAKDIHKAFFIPGRGVHWKMLEDLSGPYPVSDI